MHSINVRVCFILRLSIHLCCMSLIYAIPFPCLSDCQILRWASLDGLDAKMFNINYYSKKGCFMIKKEIKC